MQEATTAPPAIQARGLTKRYGGLVAVDAIDLDIPEGVCFGLLGPNGAGKTTTIRMIQCVSPPTSGTLRVLGDDVADRPRIIKGRLGVVPQDDNLDPDFTVRDNLIIYSRFFGVPAAAARERADELLRFLDLTDKAAGRIDQLSGGMKRRLIVARALVNDPQILVLDEPTTGLDPQARHALWDTIRRLRRRGKTILLTTHYMEEAEMLCDELVIVDKGRVLEQGRPRDLIQKHVGREAVEFVVADREGEAEGEDLDAIAADLESRGVPHERLGDRVLAFGDGLEDVMTDIRDRHPVQESLLRRATLEDVFLRLTGRALRE